MKIRYVETLQRGWNRMEKALFHPFDINKWFVVGFTAFLAGLMDFNSSYSGGYDRSPDIPLDDEDWLNAPAHAWEWLMEHAWWFGLIIGGMVVLIIILLVLTWISSRGKFMFLDNVIHNRGKVREPWNKYGSLGDSLFVWRLIFGLVTFGIFIIASIFSFVWIRNMIVGDFSVAAKIWIGIGLGLQFLVLIVVISYIALFLTDFVVPIMYKDNLSATKAWVVFLRIFNSNPGHFLLYGLFRLALGILLFFVILMFGFLTCCVGFVLLIIPYIGSVILLPVSYTFRAFSVEYLEQFGDDLKFFPPGENTLVSEV